ncbi:MAG: hypothetical protein M9921_02245 [Fimbriimonadaceae bacterium]|nr:hypothetical protein [Chthonomonadaceae bacterium]MCO5295656.1 hypothetical protein [Fimbriimonadaceae bacterium]
MEHSKATATRYLTVQDILWTNLQATKAVQGFRYAPLEEVASYQYAYGSSNAPIDRADRFLMGFFKLRPFDRGNEATGFLACFAFLMLNGIQPTLPDAEGANWLEKIGTEAVQAHKALEMVVEPAEGHAPETVEAAVRTLLDRYPATLASLREATPSAV